jgi:hypothetical protein
MAISDSAFANAVYTRLAGQTLCLESATTAHCKVKGKRVPTISAVLTAGFSHARYRYGNRTPST